jgi:hypothetical protein
MKLIKNNLKNIVVILLVMVMPALALMPTYAGIDRVTSERRVENNIESTQDFEELAEKYQEFFVQNDNGTVSLDLSRRTRSGITIDTQEQEVMQQYATMLDNINELVDNGTMYISEDGEYLMTERQAVRDWTGGKNEFKIRTKKVFFIPIPVGYHISFGTIGAITFGAITAAIYLGSAYMVTKLFQGVAATLEAILEVAHFASSFFIESFENIFNILYGIFVLGTAINVMVNAAAPGVGTLILTLVNLLSGYIFDTIGNPFLLNGINIIESSHNTVMADTNLVLQNRSFWTERT